MVPQAWWAKAPTKEPCFYAQKTVHCALGRPAPPPAHCADTSVTARTHFALVRPTPPQRPGTPVARRADSLPTHSQFAISLTHLKPAHSAPRRLPRRRHLATHVRAGEAALVAAALDALLVRLEPHAPVPLADGVLLAIVVLQKAINIDNTPRVSCEMSAWRGAVALWGTLLRRSVAGGSWLCRQGSGIVWGAT